MLSQMANESASLETLFHALADPTRRAVVRRLGLGPATVGELARPFAIALPSFLKHLGVLEAAGLIGSRKEGRVRTCALRPERLAEGERFFAEMRRDWAGRYDGLDRLLTELQREEDPDGR